MKKRLLAVLLAMSLVGVTLLSGCGGGGGSESTKAEGEGGDGKTIVYWSMWEATEPQAIALQAAIDKYQEDTGNKVDVQFKGRTGIREGLQPALDAGTTIDLFDEDIDRVNGTWGDYLLDLEDLAKESDYDATAIPGLMSAAREVGGGTLKSIPYQPNVFAVFYNQDLFKQAGIEAVPTTWDEFLAVCEKLKAAGITPLTCDDAYIDCMFGYHMSRLIGEKADVEEGTALEDIKPEDYGTTEVIQTGSWAENEAVLKTAEAYEELASKGYFSKNIASNVWPAGQNTELATGQVAMYLNGSWLPNEVKGMTGDDFKWGCFSYPAVEGGKTGVEAANFGAQVFAINKDSKVSKEAFELIKYFTKGEFDQKLSQDSVGIPADTSNEEWPAMLSAVKPVMDSLTTRYTWAAGAECDADMTPIIKENFIKLCAGKLTAKEFVDTMEKASK